MDPLLEIFSMQGRANRSWYFWHIVLDDVVIFTVAIVLAVVIGVTASPLLVLPALFQWQLVRLIPLPPLHPPRPLLRLELRQLGLLG